MKPAVIDVSARMEQNKLFLRDEFNGSHLAGIIGDGDQSKVLDWEDILLHGGQNLQRQPGGSAAYLSN